MKKLNDIINNNNVTAYGFPSFKGLEKHCYKNGNCAIISTLAPALMLDKGIDTYYSPVIPRNTVFNSAEEIIAANLDAVTTHVTKADDIISSDEVIIVSRHGGTVDLLTAMYPNNTVFSSIEPDDIKGKKVVGALPPHLIQYALAYKATTIRDFDYAVDGDLMGEELKARLIITDAISVTVDVEERIVDVEERIIKTIWSHVTFPMDVICGIGPIKKIDLQKDSHFYIKWDIVLKDAPKLDVYYIDLTSGQTSSPMLVVIHNNQLFYESFYTVRSVKLHWREFKLLGNLLD